MPVNTTPVFSSARQGWPTNQHPLFLGVFPCTGNAVCNLHQSLFDKRLDIHFPPLAANLSIPARFLNFEVNPSRPSPLKKVSV